MFGAKRFLSVALLATVIPSGVVPASAFAESSIDFPDAVKASLAKPGGATITPEDPRSSVQLRGSNTQISISMPNAATARRSIRSGGMTLYPNTTSDNAIIPTKDGAQFLIVAKNRKAPVGYTYRLGLPKRVHLLLNKEGGANVIDKQGGILATVLAPWAKDAKGKVVSTRFVSDGTNLTQIVEHRIKGITYPVMADPWYKWYSNGVVVTFSKWETGILGASSAFTPIWIASAVVSGKVGNKLYQNAWRLQLAAAYEAARGRCLWVWAPVWGDIATGGYGC